MRLPWSANAFLVLLSSFNVAVLTDLKACIILCAQVGTVLCLCEWQESQVRGSFCDVLVMVNIALMCQACDLLLESCIITPQLVHRVL